MDNNQTYDITFYFDMDLKNNIPSYEKLISFHNIIKNVQNKNILLDFRGTQFIAANLIALLGGIFHNSSTFCNHNFSLRNVHSKILKLFRKNGFGRFFRLEPLQDEYNSTMKYSIFNATTENLVKFEKYINSNVLHRDNIPPLSPIVKDNITDNLLEIFNNVIDHADSDHVFVCGQYFPKKGHLTFSIVDFGNTIKYNVTTYFNNLNCPCPNNTIEWALQKGNSTKSINAPGGLGLSILQQFLDSNKGEFIVISSNEIYHQKREKHHYDVLYNPFQGTIITVTINLKDKFIYLLNNETTEKIYF